MLSFIFKSLQKAFLIKMTACWEQSLELKKQQHWGKNVFYIYKPTLLIHKRKQSQEQQDTQYAISSQNKKWVWGFDTDL